MIDAKDYAMSNFAFLTFPFLIYEIGMYCIQVHSRIIKSSKHIEILTEARVVSGFGTAVIFVCK